MTTTYEDVQVMPTLMRSVDSLTIDHLNKAGRLLVESAEHLAKNPPAYYDGAKAAQESIIAAYHALLSWHGHELPDGASFTTIARRAESYASMLRTYHNHAVALHAITASMDGASSLSITQREGAFTGFHTARNALTVVISLLPERITAEAAQSVRNARSIQSGAAA